MKSAMIVMITLRMKGANGVRLELAGKRICKRSASRGRISDPWQFSRSAGEMGLSATRLAQSCKSSPPFPPFPPVKNRAAEMPAELTDLNRSKGRQRRDSLDSVRELQRNGDAPHPRVRAAP